MFARIGVECMVLSWNDTIDCFNALSLHSLVIFYRVPAFEGVLDMIHEANRLGLRTIWEVDDLIFDRDILEASRTLAELDGETFRGLLNGAILYSDAMLACDEGIASTQGLAVEMLNAGVPHVTLVENALDQETLFYAKNIVRRTKDESIRIVYGSGTNTHNVDFSEAADAVLSCMRKYPEVKFCLIGLLDLPWEFEQFESRIERIPYCSYNEYLGHLAGCDISIAPLEDYVFNEAKSNIKFLEAAIVKVPSVCSPRSAFSEAISDGENAFLCDTDQAWESALSKLIESQQLRESMGLRAFDSVVDKYSPSCIAESQLGKLLDRCSEPAPKKRILSVNIYYSPRSFGGATIVAEEVNKILNQKDDIDIFVFTALQYGIIPDYSLRRYDANGVGVFAISLPEHMDAESQFENPEVLAAFSEVVALIKPDIVHFHCLQGLGVLTADYCFEKSIPYYITLHDAWWLCGRQFMIDRSGKYCGQEVIDLEICAKCVETPSLNVVRQAKLSVVLNNAEMLFAPSQYFADFFKKNGFSEQKILVNKNGIKKALKQVRTREMRPIRFGYVGGNTRIKGFHLVKKAFEALEKQCNTELIVVDNMTILGFSSFDDVFYPSQLNVKIVPAYTQDNIDEFFSKIDVLLFPTQWKESFGLTVREAIARNVWVIATDAGGVIEDIIPAVNGTVIPFDDDGGHLHAAMLEQTIVYDAMEAGTIVSLDNSRIATFEDQASELYSVFSPR
jgi:glycosyltransferase involved in cell wall biosynthesis